MRMHRTLAGIAAVALMAATSACRHEQPGGLSPNLLRALVVPAPGQTDSAVVAMNGAPDLREHVADRELWVYNRAAPDGLGLRRTTAAVWFREGIVVDVNVTSSVFTPSPTIPDAPFAAADAR